MMSNTVISANIVLSVKLILLKSNTKQHMKSVKELEKRLKKRSCSDQKTDIIYLKGYLSL